MLCRSCGLAKQRNYRSRLVKLQIVSAQVNPSEYFWRTLARFNVGIKFFTVKCKPRKSQITELERLKETKLN